MHAPARPARPTRRPHGSGDVRVRAVACIPMIIAVPVEPNGLVGHTWGRAPVVAVASVVDGQLETWDAFDVGWDISHGSGTHGSHHARVVGFLREHAIDVVAVDHVGDGMRRTLQSMGVTLVDGVAGTAREAVVEVAAGLGV